jgi:hypothetical protein
MNKIVLDKFDLKLRIFIQLFSLLQLSSFYYFYESSFILWACCIGLYLTTFALTFKNRLAMSIAFIGCSLSCSLWMVDSLGQFTLDKFVFGFRASYLFFNEVPFWFRSLSLYHVLMPVVWIYYLKKWGYEPKAFCNCVILFCTELIIIYFLSDPLDNINWVFLPTLKGWQNISPLTWLILEMVLLVVFVWLPLHLIAMRIFKK